MAELWSRCGENVDEIMVACDLAGFKHAPRHKWLCPFAVNKAYCRCWAFRNAVDALAPFASGACIGIAANAQHAALCMVALLMAGMLLSAMAVVHMACADADDAMLGHAMRKLRNASESL